MDVEETVLLETACGSEPADRCWDSGICAWSQSRNIFRNIRIETVLADILLDELFFSAFQFTEFVSDLLQGVVVQLIHVFRVHHV